MSTPDPTPERAPESGSDPSTNRDATDLKPAQEPDTVSTQQAESQASKTTAVAADARQRDFLGDYDDQPRGWWERLARKIEERISVLSTRNNFWHRVITWVFLPLAYRSGIKFHKGDESTFSAVLPFKKFNRNWYNAMAGGALLGNAEVAGGMYVFGIVGKDYTVVCKHLEYTFRRPCLGPAVYRIEPRENIEELMATQPEFNITIDMRIVQMLTKKEARERRVGNCVATFHIAPKAALRRHAQKRRERSR